MHICPRNRRGAFTLLELLVVIAILGLLATITWAAIMEVLRTRARYENGIEIARLDTVLKAYYARRPPSRIKLCEKRSDYGTSTLDLDSLAFLQTKFPGIDWNSPQSPPAPAAAWAGIDWNGNGIADGPVVLYGDQCLVFFLGGIPLPGSQGGPAGQGFSKNPADPSTPGGTRELPLYKFESKRLYDRFGNGFYSYRDAYGQQPFAYFSDYNRYPGSDCPGLGPGNGPGISSGGNDLYPYASSSGAYLNQNSCQIISAGPDMKFGFGSHPSIVPTPFWTSATAAAMYPSLAGHPDQNSYQDDQTNFSRGTLQAGP